MGIKGRELILKMFDEKAIIKTYSEKFQDFLRRIDVYNKHA